MDQLRLRDLRAALQFALHAQATCDTESFAGDLLPELRRLVPCDWVGYNEIDFRHAEAVVVSDARRFDGMQERFFALSHQHPLLMQRRRGDLRTCMLSDYLTPRAFHGLELYQDFYRLREIEDQVSFGLPGDVCVTVALSRSRRGFEERDRELLELVRPQLTAAYHRAREQTRRQALSDALAAGLEEQDAGILQLDGQGRVVDAAGAARDLLEAYFRPPSQGLEVLPAQLASWLRAAPAGSAPDTLAVGGPRGRLHVRAQPATRDGWRMLVLEERRACPPSLDRLRAHGLTHREAQVLSLVARGKTNRQIAAELGVSTATVGKHLEHIYSRLGVGSRTQALARIRG